VAEVTAVTAEQGAKQFSVHRAERKQTYFVGPTGSFSLCAISHLGRPVSGPYIKRLNTRFLFGAVQKEMVSKKYAPPRSGITLVLPPCGNHIRPEGG